MKWSLVMELSTASTATRRAFLPAEDEGVAQRIKPGRRLPCETNQPLSPPYSCNVTVLK